MNEVAFWDQHQRWPTIRLIVGDITALPVDAIVTGVEPDFVLGGGVNAAIHRVAGPALLAATTQIGGCELGQAVITDGFKLPAKYVIHTACPIYHESEESKQTLTSCYNSSLNLAIQYQCASTAFPSLATGMFGFPHEVAANVASRAIRNFIFEKNESQSTVKDITFVIFHSENFDIYAKVFSEIFV